jgi:branched-chain amino acid transport system substrate-binding protein
MRKYFLGRAALIAVMALATILAGCSISTDDTVSKALCVATDFPASGADGAQGKPAQNGADLAISQAKLSGGYTLVARDKDDATNGMHDEGLGAMNVTAVASDDCVLALVGPLHDSVAAAEMPIAANAGLAMISPATSNAGLTKKEAATAYGLDYAALHPAEKPLTFFRLPVPDDGQAVADAQLALDAGHKHVYIVDDAQITGKALATFFAQAFTARGGSVVGSDSLPDTAAQKLADLSGQIKAAGADVVYYSGLMSAAGAALRLAMTNAGLVNVAMIGGRGIANDPTFIEAATPAAAEGTLATLPAADLAALMSPAAQQFAKDYKARYGTDATNAAVYGFDAANVVVAAIGAVIDAGQTPTRENVRRQIATGTYQGLTGLLSFDANGDDVGTQLVSVYSVRNGSWVYVKRATAV